MAIAEILRDINLAALGGAATRDDRGVEIVADC